MTGAKTEHIFLLSGSLLMRTEPQWAWLALISSSPPGNRHFNNSLRARDVVWCFHAHHLPGSFLSLILHHPSESEAETLRRTDLNLCPFKSKVNVCEVFVLQANLHPLCPRQDCPILIKCTVFLWYASFLKMKSGLNRKDDIHLTLDAAALASRYMDRFISHPTAWKSTAES